MHTLGEGNSTVREMWVKVEIQSGKDRKKEWQSKKMRARDDGDRNKKMKG